MSIANNHAVQLYYEQSGIGKPFLIFINGMTAPGHGWKNILDDVNPHYQVITFDNRGTGRSSVPSLGYSVDDMADDVIALMKHLGITNADFVGHAFGGCILQNLAYRYPAWVNRAVIGSSFLRLSRAFKKFCDTRLSLVKTISRAQMIELMLPWSFGETFLSTEGRFENLVEQQLANTEPQTIQGYLGQYHAMATFDSTVWIRQLRCPTLILAGAEDIVSLAQDQENLAQQIPNAIFRLIEKAGHNLLLENRTDYIKEIKNFLQIT